MAPEIVTVGRVVHYVTAGGTHLAAMVTATGRGGIEDTCSLVSFVPDHHQPVAQSFVPFDPAGKIPHSWHWPERSGVQIDYSQKLPGDTTQ